jgi:hypothetical protein
VELDGMMILGLGLAMSAFVVQKGVSDLGTFLTIFAAGVAVLQMKAFLSAEALMLIAGIIVASNIFTSKNANSIVLLIFGACLCGSIMVLKLFLPAFIMVRLAISVIFLGALKIILF